MEYEVIFSIIIKVEAEDPFRANEGAAERISRVPGVVAWNCLQNRNPRLRDRIVVDGKIYVPKDAPREDPS